MEGKAALFKRFANIDAWPICLASQDTDEIVKAVEMIAPGFGGINLEDIAAPRCFEIERRLRESRSTSRSSTTTSTAPRSWCWPPSPTRCAWSKKEHGRRSGWSSPVAGAAGTAIVTLLLAAGRRRTWSSSTGTARSAPATRRSPTAHRELAAVTNPRRVTGDLHDVLRGADVFIGVSAPGILQPEWIADMADKPVVFALANPDPEVDPAEAEKYAAVVASGRSDYPNQINNVLAFPGVFRGLLDARADRHHHRHAAARRRGDRAWSSSDEELNPNFIIPTVFNAEVPEGRRRGDPRRRARRTEALALDAEHVLRRPLLHDRPPGLEAPPGELSA